MKFKLSHKVLILVLFSALISGGVMIAIASSAVSTELQRQLRDATERCVSLLDASFVAKVDGARSITTTDGGVRIIAPRLETFRDDSIVDDNVRLLGGTASIFTFDQAKGTAIALPS